ncbi:MAG: DUF2007 domain-containing protein [Kofleriaceae bacterium]|nr:DUF2007 domain-containing protein [Kofleriaceae bacterium]MCL4226932.1 DUF2007 domain-containing protein [Myxococcales bacterium]
MSDQRTVRVATCHDPAEATMIRTVLSAHGIDAMIPGEASASLGTAAVGFITHVFVDAEDAEDAAALIHELREGPAPGAGDADDGTADGDGADGPPAEEGAADADGAGAAVALVAGRRVSLVAVVVLAMTPGFGTAHMATGAWKRGLALAAVELVGVRHAVSGNRLGVLLIVLAVVADLIGGVVRVRARRRREAPALPEARIVPRGGPPRLREPRSRGPA